MSTTKFKKGQCGNPKGRPKGSKNKRTEQWQDLYDYMLSDGFERLKEELSKLEGKNYVDTILRLINHFKPSNIGQSTNEAWSPSEDHKEIDRFLKLHGLI